MAWEAEDLPSFLRLVARLRNFAGALITMPHKTAVVDLLDEARSADGQLIGDMFDGEGFTRGALREGRVIAGASSLVVGAGGVGFALAASLAHAGIARLGLFDTNAGQCAGVAERLRLHFPDVLIETDFKDPEGWNIIVNATPLSMKVDDPLPLDVKRIEPESFVGELVMTAEETRFLVAARARGCATQIGTDMLFEQVPAYLEFLGFPTTTPDKLRKLTRVEY